MQNKENTMIEHLLNWKLSDLIESYNLEADANNEIEKTLNELVMRLIKDIKGSDTDANKNN